MWCCNVFFSLLKTERIPSMLWNSTLTRRTFLTCGKRRCFRTRRKRGKKGGSKGWEMACFTSMRSSVYSSSACSSLAFPSTFFRSRSDVWKAARFSVRWRRWERLETVGRSGTWWLSIKNSVQTTATHRLFGEEHHQKVHCLQMAGEAKCPAYLCNFLFGPPKINITFQTLHFTV